MAVKQINLLPKTYREHARKKQVTPLYVMSICVSAACVFGLYYYLNWQVNDLQVQKTQSLSANNITKTSVVALTEAKTEVSTLRKVTILNNISKNDADWNKVFTSVAAILPKDITITTFVITGAASGGGINLKISGEAPSTNSFASFMAYLTESKSLLSSKVESFTYNPVNKKITFALSGTLPADKSIFTKSSSSSGGVK